MAFKGSIQMFHGGKVQTMYPKTIAEQVKLSASESLLDKLSELDAAKNTQVVTDPDLIITNGVHSITGSVNMPTIDTYLIDAKVLDDNIQYQSAYCSNGNIKYDRWKTDGVWMPWSMVDNIEYTQVQYVVTTTADSTTVAIPNGIDLASDLFLVYKNTTFINDTYYTINGTDIVFAETIKSNTEITFVVSRVNKDSISATRNHKMNTIGYRLNHNLDKFVNISVYELIHGAYVTLNHDVIIHDKNSVEILVPNDFKCDNHHIQDNGDCTFTIFIDNKELLIVIN